MTPARCTARIDPRHAGRHGFTLVELVVVLVVIASIAGLALPAYGSAVARYRLESASHQLIAGSQRALAHARAFGAPITVRFDIAAHTITFGGLPNRANADHVLDLRQHPMEARIFSADFAGRAQYVVSGYGVPDSGGVVVLGNPSGSRTLVFDGITGLVGVSP